MTHPYDGERPPKMPAGATDFSNVQGIIADLDGTMYDASGAIPGAGTAVRALRAAGFGIRFVTNTTRCPHADVVNRLRQLEIDVVPDEVFTAPRACAAWLRRQAVCSVAMHLPKPTRVEFDAFVTMFK